MGCYAVVVAAGRGQRLNAGVNKVLLPLQGKPLVRHCLEALQDCPQVEAVVVVGASQELDALRFAARGLDKCRWFVAGGETRQRSVYNGLCALPFGHHCVLVHDGARPFLSQELLRRCIASVQEFGSGVASLPVSDTVKLLDEQGVPSTLDRSRLRSVQTPQGFYLDELLEAYESAFADNAALTDDASAMERRGRKVHLVMGEANNIKITQASDLELSRLLAGDRLPVTGQGFDVHRLVPGRALVLCGITVPHSRGLLGHSDADVAVHALIDALLGAACLGDIGRLFPDSDERYRGICSMELLRQTLQRLSGWRVLHADVTIIAQQPKLAPYLDAMARNLAAALGGAPASVKATTTEGLGFTGRGEGIAAQAVASLCRA